MLVADQDTLASATHAMDLIMLFQALEAGQHRGVFLRLGLLGAEGVVTQGIQANCLWLPRGKVLGEDGSARIG